MLFFERTSETYGSPMKEKIKLTDGEHLFIITKHIGPQESKRSPGKFFHHFILESCDEGGEVLYSMGAYPNGMLLNGTDDGWMGQGKFNHLAEALGLGMGKTSVDNIVGGVVKGVVETDNKGYQTVQPHNLWTPTDEERDRAAQYDIERGDS